MLATAKKWNKWTNKEIPETGFAAVLTPYLADRSAVSSDVFWVNMAPNFEAMGSAQDQWVAKGSKLAAEFDEVCSNDSHSMFVGQMVRRPAAEGPQSGYIGFESCTLKEGASTQKMLAADAKFVARQASIGNTGMMANGRCIPSDGRRLLFGFRSRFHAESWPEYRPLDCQHDG